MKNFLVLFVAISLTLSGCASRLGMASHAKTKKQEHAIQGEAYAEEITEVVGAVSDAVAEEEVSKNGGAFQRCTGVGAEKKCTTISVPVDSTYVGNCYGDPYCEGEYYTREYNAGRNLDKRVERLEKRDAVNTRAHRLPDSKESK